MGKRRSLNRKKKYDDACSKINTIKTCDNNCGVARPWSDLNHDMLFLVMMKLGVVDFIAFSEVCKSWRSLSLSNRNKFIVSRPPMSISMSVNDANEKRCYLKDFEGRKLNISLPHFTGRTCIGVTCGYLILLDNKTNDFWPVNPITRHELYFPNVRDNFDCCPVNIGAILVFSPSISKWVLVMFHRCYNHKIWFCVSGKREWTRISTTLFPIHDLIAFNGKIYTLLSIYGSDEVGLYEMRLYSKPKLVLLELKNFPKPLLAYPGFVTCGESLYVIDRISKNESSKARFHKIHELDFDEMKWVSRENIGKKYAIFRNDFMHGDTFTLREVWADIHSQYGKYAVKDKKGKGRLFHAKMWYFFDDCLNVNLIHE